MKSITLSSTIKTFLLVSFFAAGITNQAKSMKLPKRINSTQYLEDLNKIVINNANTVYADALIEATKEFSEGIDACRKQGIQINKDFLSKYQNILTKLNNWVKAGNQIQTALVEIEKAFAAYTSRFQDTDFENQHTEIKHILNCLNGNFAEIKSTIEQIKALIKEIKEIKFVYPGLESLLQESELKLRKLKAKHLENTKQQIKISAEQINAERTKLGNLKTYLKNIKKALANYKEIQDKLKKIGTDKKKITKKELAKTNTEINTLNTKLKNNIEEAQKLLQTLNTTCAEQTQEITHQNITKLCNDINKTIIQEELKIKNTVETLTKETKLTMARLAEKTATHTPSQKNLRSLQNDLREMLNIFKQDQKRPISCNQVQKFNSKAEKKQMVKKETLVLKKLDTNYKNAEKVRKQLDDAVMGKRSLFRRILPYAATTTVTTVLTLLIAAKCTGLI